MRSDGPDMAIEKEQARATGIGGRERAKVGSIVSIDLDKQTAHKGNTKYQKCICILLNIIRARESKESTKFVGSEVVRTPI